MLARSLAALSDKASCQPRPQSTDCAHLASCIKFISSLTLTLPHFATFCLVLLCFVCCLFRALLFAFLAWSALKYYQLMAFRKKVTTRRQTHTDGWGKGQGQRKGRCIMFQVEQLRWRYLKKFPAARRLSRKIRMFMATLSHCRQHSRVSTSNPANPTHSDTPSRLGVCYMWQIWLAS